MLRKGRRDGPWQELARVLGCSQGPSSVLCAAVLLDASVLSCPTPSQGSCLCPIPLTLWLPIPSTAGHAHLSGSGSHGSGRLRCGCPAAAAAPPLSPDSRPHTATCTAAGSGRTDAPSVPGMGTETGTGGPTETPVGCVAPGFRYGALGLGHRCHIPKLSSDASNGPGGAGAAAAVCPWDNPGVWGVPAEPPTCRPGLTPTCAALWPRSCWG